MDTNTRPSPPPSDFQLHPANWPDRGGVDDTGPQPAAGPDPRTGSRPTGRWRRRTIAAGALAAVAIGSGTTGAALAGHFATPTVTTVVTAPAPVALTSSAASTQHLAKVAAAVQPSVVSIIVTAANGSSEGSGILLRSDGTILTNNHVVAAAANGGGSIRVKFAGGKTVAATIVGRDPSTDLAVIHASGGSGLRPATLGSSANLHVGDAVLAIGSPLGLDGSVTAGIVSALHRTVGLGDSGPQQSPNGPSGQQSGSSAAVGDAIQTDAAINPGNSGGALVNMNGQLVGINSAIASLGGSSSVGGQSGSIGLGFAIPVDQANRIAQELITQGTATQAVLGVSITATTPRAALTTHGATIAAVSPGGPADKAGITAGSVVTKVNDRLIPDGDSLVAAIRSHAPGDSLTLTLTGTHGAARTVHVTLGGITVQAGR